MSNSVRPHRQQPTRLLHPWDSPGKNSGVGCHFLLQCMKVKSESEVAQSCLTLSDPMNCSLPGSSTIITQSLKCYGIFQIKTMRYHLIPVIIAIIKKSTNNKYLRGCEEKETLLYYWWEYKLEPLWKTVWRFLQKLKV